MTENQQKEQFSIAYVSALAAAAGINHYSLKVDDDSIDIGFASHLGKRPRIEVQLKCSAVCEEYEQEYRFPLKVKNYDDLRCESVIPRFLVLVVVPTDIGDWISFSTEQLTLRKAAFWISLADMGETENTSTVQVSIPKSNLLTPATFLKLLTLPVPS